MPPKREPANTADDQNQAAGNAPNMGDQIVATVQQDSQIYVETNTRQIGQFVR